ncbi:VolA/Pla-1 family phospholipase [Thalassotalea fusca]
MKKLVLGLAVASALGLSACDSESVKDVKESVAENGPAVTASSRVVFDPSNGVLSVPNDLLFLGTTDGTLNLPVDDPSNEADPFVALSALDGWSTVNPFVIELSFPDGRTLDGDSVFNPESVRVFEAIMGGDTSDADCASLERGLACKIVRELTYISEFATQKSGDSVAVVPTAPLKPKTTYILVMTDKLKDSSGKSVAPSTTYELVKQDITTNPLATESQLALQGLVNSFESAVAGEGVDKSTIIYSMAMTTQSTSDVLMTYKSLLAGNLALGQFPAIGVADTGLSVADALAGQIPAEAVPLYSAANLMAGTIELPYYLGVPSPANPMAPVNEWWTSQCDSGAMLAALAAANPGAIPADPVSVSDAKCMAVSQAANLPAPGLRDLRGVIDLDTERNLTRYSPVPEATVENMTIHVQMTTPDINWVNAVRAAQPELGLPQITEMPENGWPVVILQHGITSKKEDMLPMTGLLSLYGMATVAINHPLHGDPSLGPTAGSRGFDLNGDGVDDINASTVSATHYMNLASLLTTRDNLRQSTADMVGLRFGLNFLGGVDSDGNPIKVDSSQVHFLGHSLGAITGINFMALTNTSLDPAVDPMFKVQTNSLAMPGIMVANFLFESGAFGNLIKANLTYNAVESFKALVDTNFPQGATEEQLVATYLAFYASLDDATKAQIDGIFSQFAFAAQTVTDSGDPINYTSMMRATQTPTHLIEVVGDGADNLSDQVIPNSVATAPLAGTEGAIALLGLSGVSETTQGSGAVRFTKGHHGSILDPRPNDAAPDPMATGAATLEMQSQVTGFFASMGQLIQVTNTDVVQ